MQTLKTQTILTRIITDYFHSACLLLHSFIQTSTLTLDLNRSRFNQFGTAIKGSFARIGNWSTVAPVAIVRMIALTKEAGARTTVEELLQQIAQRRAVHIFRIITEEKKKLKVVIINASVEQLHRATKPPQAFRFRTRNEKWHSRRSRMNPSSWTNTLSLSMLEIAWITLFYCTSEQIYSQQAEHSEKVFSQNLLILH